jgi:hypothetical protein
MGSDDNGTIRPSSVLVEAQAPIESDGRRGQPAATRFEMSHRCGAPTIEERHERPEISGRYLDQFLEITALKKALSAGGVKVKDIARQYGVAPQTISAAMCGQSWKTITPAWREANRYLRQALACALPDRLQPRNRDRHHAGTLIGFVRTQQSPTVSILYGRTFTAGQRIL